ncbi:MAG: NAD(P)-dependent glycerol-3-phosphate dehydrogenase [Deltaproteobacteria bacterium]|nr:NAD(P)-dependent glycerol-3-phosphate dehydrogenase [Deltaproteobacteria bacterium]
MKCTVLGAGAFGTALAIQLARQGHATTLWARSEREASAMQEARENAHYLPRAPFPENLHASSDRTRALADADLVVLAIPCQATREALVLAKNELLAPLLCCASKGIERGTLMLMSEVMLDVLGSDATSRLTYLSGPSFARELAERVPTAVTIAGTNPDTTAAVQRAFSGGALRAYATEDVMGVEVGGALKNVIAIAAGIVDGLGFGQNCRAALITRGLAEIGRLAAKKYGSPLTLAGLAGVGDLVLTCTGSLSRNRTVGVELGKGRTLATILAELGHVAEGVETTRSAFELGQRLGVAMPITEEVYRVLYEDKPAKQALLDLMGRPLKHELG